MPKSKRVARGIYRDQYGYVVIYYAHGQRHEKRFEPGRSIEHLTKWRQAAIQRQRDITPTSRRGSLARDVVQYLKHLKGLPSYKSEKSHLRAWLKRFGARQRWQLSRTDVSLAVADWRAEGYAARTIRHRCRVLQSLYRRLDGANVATPVDEVAIPRKPAPRPVSIADDKIASVAMELRKREIVGSMREAKTRARFLVLATTGRRPAEVMRAERGDIDLERRIWFTRTAKGGLNTILMLNDEMAAAWELFISAQAWGAYDCRSFAKTLRRAGWPAGIRPYNLRHSTGLAIRARGGDLEDVQDQLGHASIDTARQFYLHAIPERQKAISATLAGRFPGDAFLRTPPPKVTSAEKAKGRESARQKRRA